MSTHLLLDVVCWLHSHRKSQLTRPSLVETDVDEAIFDAALHTVHCEKNGRLLGSHAATAQRRSAEPGRAQRSEGVVFDCVGWDRGMEVCWAGPCEMVTSLFFDGSEMGRRPKAIGVEIADVTIQEPRKVTSAPKLHATGPFCSCPVTYWDFES